MRLAPQNGWDVNDPAELATVLRHPRGHPAEFNAAQTGGTQVSLADLIVLGGAAAIEQAAKNAGVDVEVPFMPGRTDATQEQTDVDSFAVLEPTADGFRNYAGKGHGGRPSSSSSRGPPAHADRAGDDRARGRPPGPRREPRRSRLGVLTDTTGTLTNDFFVNLLDIGTTWSATSRPRNVRGPRPARPANCRWIGSRADLVFGSNSVLRAIAEVYASADAKEKFVRDFVAAWDKVMKLDRFDVA